MRPMAFDKLCQLIGMASPMSRLITPDKNTRAMLAAGLAREDSKGFTITPNGLRALADQMEAGYVNDAIARLLHEQVARKAKAA